jgi:IS30 family transposase
MQTRAIRMANHSITFDNRKEFSEHKAPLRGLGIQAFFAHTYCSRGRGTTGNTNGLVRQFYPKGASIAEISRQNLADTAKRIHNRPVNVTTTK